MTTQSGAPESTTFSTDTSGLAEDVRPSIVDQADGDTSALRW